jgi:ankyrin repeat protein
LYKLDVITPLHLAAAYGLHDLLLLFLSKIDKNALQAMQTDVSLLHLACLYQHTDLVQDIIDSGVDIALRTDVFKQPLSMSGANCLHLLFYRKKTQNTCVTEKVVRLILGRGIDPKLRTLVDRKSALYMASQNGYSDAVKVFLKNKCQTNLKDNRGKAALHVASENGHTEVVRLLLEHSANPNLVNKAGKSPLHCAAYNGHTDVVRLLLEHSANPNLADCTERSPLNWAEQKGNTDVVNMLLMNMQRLA